MNAVMIGVAVGATYFGVARSEGFDALLIAAGCGLSYLTGRLTT